MNERPRPLPAQRTAGLGSRHTPRPPRWLGRRIPGCARFAGSHAWRGSGGRFDVRGRRRADRDGCRDRAAHERYPPDHTPQRPCAATAPTRCASTHSRSPTQTKPPTNPSSQRDANRASVTGRDASAKPSVPPLIHRSRPPPTRTTHRHHRRTSRGWRTRRSHRSGNPRRSRHSRLYPNAAAHPRDQHQHRTSLPRQPTRRRRRAAPHTSRRHDPHTPAKP